MPGAAGAWDARQPRNRVHGSASTLAISGTNGFLSIGPEDIRERPDHSRQLPAMAIDARSAALQQPGHHGKPVPRNRVQVDDRLACRNDVST